MALCIPVVFLYFSGDQPFLPYDTDAEVYIVQGIQIALAAFLTLRVRMTKGLFSSILLLLWVLFEVGFKIATGQLWNPGYIFMWACVLLNLFHSVRGHWKLRAYRRLNA